MVKYFLFPLILIFNLYAAQYYARADGTAANIGAATGPTTDATKCMNATVFNAASFPSRDTTNFSDKGGVYLTMIIPPTAGITIRAATGESPIISGSDNEGTPSYDRNQGIWIQVDSVTIDGFEVRYCGADNIWVGYTTKGTIIKNCFSHHCQYDGIKGANTANFNILSTTVSLNGDDGVSLHDSAYCGIDYSFLDTNGTDGLHNVMATDCDINNTSIIGNVVAGIHIGGHASVVAVANTITNNAQGFFAYDTGTIVANNNTISGGDYGYHSSSFANQYVAGNTFSNHIYYGFYHEYGYATHWIRYNTFSSCGNSGIIVQAATKIRIYYNRFYCDGIDLRAAAEFNIGANIFDTSSLFSIKNASLISGNTLENCYFNDGDNVLIWGDTDTGWTARNCIFRSPNGDNFYNVSKVIFDHCISDGADLPDTLSNISSAVIDTYIVSTDPAAENYAMPKALSLGTGANVTGDSLNKYYNNYSIIGTPNRGAMGVQSLDVIIIDTTINTYTIDNTTDSLRLDTIRMTGTAPTLTFSANLHLGVYSHSLIIAGGTGANVIYSGGNRMPKIIARRGAKLKVK